MAKYYYHSLFLIFFVNIIITIINLLNKTVRVKSLQTAYPMPVDFQPDGLLKLLIRYPFEPTAVLNVTQRMLLVGGSATLT